MSELSKIADEIEALEEEFSSRLEALRARVLAYDASLGKQAKVRYVGQDGRLTEAGVRYCEKAFEEGRGPSEIAAAIGVTVPAIVMRRQRWARLQGKGQ